MQQSYNINNRWEMPLLLLANPQKTYKNNGVIPYVKDLNLVKKFNNIWELTFKVYEYEDGIKNEIYDYLESKRLIEVRNIGWFQIDEFPEDFLDNDPVPHKTVKCLSMENQLVNKRIDAINGTYSLYDVSNTEFSLLHIVHDLCGWNIGHIDSELLSLYRTFQVDTDMIYNFLTTAVSTSFDCIFQFDNYTKTISAYKFENIGETTDIIISEKNLLNKATVESFGNQIVTKILVKGNDTCDIRAVNPNATNYLINIDYYLTTEWMSQGLIDGWNSYKTAYNNAQSNWTSLITSLKTKNGELTILKAELVDLQSAQTAQSDVYSSILQNNGGTVPPVGSADYTIYINALNSYNSYFPLIASKQSAIATKQAEITSVHNSLDFISNNLDIGSFLTSEQITELNTFLIEGEAYQDDTFVVTETMSEEEAIQMKLELMDNGARQLAIYSHPQYTYKISAKNLFSIIDNPENVCKYEDWREQLDIGNYVTIMLREDYWVTTRIMELDIDYNNLEEIQIVLSDKTKEDTRTTQMSELLANAGRTNAALGMYKYGYGQARGQVSDVRTFLNSSLNATLNSVVNNDNQDLLIDTYGLHMRKWLPDENRFSDYQSWWLNNVLLFTDDGFQSATTAIGLLTAPDGSNYWGLNTEVLVGSLIMGERMILTNSSGNYTWDNNGMVASATVGANTYLVGINPSTPSNIFRIAVNGVNKLYVDTINNRLNIEGYINATGGTLGNLNVIGTLTGGIISGSSISGGYITGVSISGSSFVSTGTLGSTILTTTINNGYITSDGFIRVITSGYTCEVSANNITIKNPSNTLLSSYGEGAYLSGTLTVLGDALLTNAVCNTLKVNNSDVITVANRSSYTFNPSSHMHSSNDIIADVQESAYIQFYGGRGAGYNWCLSTFELKSPSDFRLKKNVKPLDELPIELFMELKPYMYELKCKGYGDGIRFGFFSQMVESAFLKFGLNAIDYNLIEIIDSSSRTDEGEYVLDGKIHRLCYENFHAWDIYVTQYLYSVYSDLNNRVINIEKLLTAK